MKEEHRLELFLYKCLQNKIILYINIYKTVPLLSSLSYFYIIYLILCNKVNYTYFSSYNNNLHVLLSPGDNLKSQNKIFGFVFNIACPLSCCHGTKVVSVKIPVL